MIILYRTINFKYTLAEFQFEIELYKATQW